MTYSIPHQSKRALIVGGTGPTGPAVVNGVLSRGFDTTIFHGGKHEIPLPHEVKHIHGDAHFPETIAEALDGHEFEVVIAQYGRLRHLVDYFAGRVEHLIAIGGMNSPLADPADPRWGDLGRPSVIREDNRILLDEPGEGGSLGFKIAETARALLAAGERGDFRATYIVYPTLYGPRQPGCPEWHVVRRIRDGRRKLILPDAGLRLESRAFVGNVAQAPLLALDRPDIAAGKTYVVTDQDVYSTRQRVEFIAAHLGVDLDIIDMPYDLATPAHPLYRAGRTHRVGLASSIRDELGYTDTVDTAEALRQTTDWLMAESPEAIDEIERQLGDPFDYRFEDELAAWWSIARDGAPQTDADYSYSHIYRHPKTANEDWTTRR